MTIHNKMEKILKNLGLNEKEVKIYLALLELGSATIQMVAQKSGVTRTNIYDHLGSMKEKGLITEIQYDKKKLLTAEDPHNLKKMAQNNLDKLNGALPQLLGIFNTPGTKPKIKNYEGVNGLYQVYDLILKDKPNQVCAIIDVEQMMEALPSQYMWDWADKRAEQNIFFNAIIRDGKLGRLAKKKIKDKNV